MLSTTRVHACRACGGGRLYKNGHTVGGAQRVKCKDCGRTFTLAPRGPRCSEASKAQVLAARQERMSLRGIKRAFGVCCQTIVAWVGRESGESPSL